METPRAYGKPGGVDTGQSCCSKRALRKRHLLSTGEPIKWRNENGTRATLLSSLRDCNIRDTTRREQQQQRRRRCWRFAAFSFPRAMLITLGLMAASCAVQASSAGLSHTCAILSDDTIKCWGDNSQGQLGLNDGLVRGTQVQDMGDNLPAVPLGDDFIPTHIASGTYHNCAVNDWQGMKCWGKNEYGQLGLGDNVTRGDNNSNNMGNELLTVQLGDEEYVDSVALGKFHSCAVLTTSKLKCWGRNTWGQLGLGDDITRGDDPNEMGNNLPEVALGEGVNVSAVALGIRHTCVLLNDGLVKCWGANDSGALGYEDTAVRGIASDDMGENLAAVDLGRDQRAVAIATGAFHSCALLTTGKVKCWGFGSDGQLGQGSDSNIGDAVGTMGDDLPPIELGSNVTARAIACGASYTCAVLDDETVKCWGLNSAGVLGLGDLVTRGTLPDQMGDNLPAANLTFGRGLGAVNNVMSGTVHTCTAGIRGGLACFGLNSDGQLGVGNSDNQGDEPGEVQELESIFLGQSVTVVNPSPPAGDFEVEVPSSTPTPAPLAESVPYIVQPNTPLTPAPSTFMTSTFMDKGTTRAPITEGSGAPETSAPANSTQIQNGDDASRGDIAISITIAGAAIVVSLVVAAVLFWCYRKRKRQREIKGQGGRGVVPGATVSEAHGNGSNDFNSQGSVASSELHVEANADGTPEVLAQKPLVKPFAVQSTTPLSGPEEVTKRSSGSYNCDSSSSPGLDDYDEMPSTTVVPLLSSNDGDVETALPAISTATLATAEAVAMPDAIPSSVPLASVAVGTLSTTDDDESGPNWARLGPTSPPASSVASDPENPGELRRRGMSRSSSGSSLSTLASTSTTSTAWTNSDPFNTPARTDIPRGSGNVRYTGNRSRGHAVVGSGGSEDSESRRARAVTVVGTATPASLAAATPGRLVPDTPSPRSTISTASTPHPPEMRLAQFVRAGNTENYLYGVPEMDIGRSSTTLDSNRDDGIEGWHGPSGRSHFRDVSLSGTSASSASASVPAGGDSIITTAPGVVAAGATAAASAVALLASSGGSSRTVGNNANGSVNPTVVGSGGATASLTGASSTASSPPAETAGGGLGSSPIGVSISTPDRRRIGSGVSAGQPSGAMMGTGATGIVMGAAGASDVPSRRKSVTRSNRSSRTSGTGGAASPGPTDTGERSGGGEAGAMEEWNAQSFTEEAELEAMQIDKNDLKLVFGRPFARGKTSEVYQVTHEGKNRAAKIIDLFSQGVVGNEVTRLYSCFAPELRTMKGIRHSCVSSVYGAVATPSELTIVTDLVKRGPLRSILDDKGKRESLTHDVRHKILKDVARGMAYLAEQGVQHRNLHSHNVLITNSWGAKVADYGLSRTIEVLMCADGSGNAAGGKRKVSSWRLATLRWTAPELIALSSDGSEPYTTASDVYSMGVIAWEILCGGPKLPYDGISNEKVKSMILEGSTPSIPMETPIVYAKLILQCWRKNPTLRPTFSHIAEVLLNDPPPKPT